MPNQLLPYVIFLSAILSSNMFLAGQPLKRLNSIGYTVNEGLQSSKVTDLAEDGNGFIWISTGNGLQRFNGRTFSRIIPGKGKDSLPDDKDAHFFKRQNGNLLINHSKGISEYDIHTDLFREIFSTPFSGRDTTIIAILTEDDEGIWCSVYPGGIHKLNKKTHQFADSISFPPGIDTHPYAVYSLGETPLFFGYTETKIFILGINNHYPRVYSVNDQQGKFVAVAQYTEDTLLAATTRGIEKLDVHSGNFSLICPYKTLSSPMVTEVNVRLRVMPNGLCLVSEGPGLFELDIKRGRYTAQLVNMQNRKFLDVGAVSGLYLDSFQNLWLLSENTGIRKLNYRVSEFKYYGLTDRSKNFVKTICVDKPANLVLCGSLDNGLLIFDTSQQLLKIIDRFPGVRGAPTVCAIRKTGLQQYLIFLMGIRKVFHLNAGNYLLKEVLLDTSATGLEYMFDYHMTIFPVNDEESIIQNSFYVYRVRWQPPATLCFKESKVLPTASITSYMDASHRLWIGGRSTYYLFEKGISAYKTFQLKEKALVRCFYDDKHKGIWLGTENGLYQLNNSGQVIRKIYKTGESADENIYAISGDEADNVWFSHNKGISCMKKDGSFINFTSIDGLQGNEFNTNTFFKSPDGELFFGGVNGITGFYPDRVIRSHEKPKLLLTSIKIKEAEYEPDTAIWNVGDIELPYFNNSLSFEFTAMGGRQPDQYNYQFRMKGVDENWINSYHNGLARYSLAPGRYTLELYSDNSFEQDAVPMKRISIHIRPPFWKTNWFIILFVLFLASILILITRHLARLKLKRRIIDLENKRTIDQERLRIAREMHDDIGAGLTQISMMSEAAKGSMDVHRLDEIANTSRKLTSNMSEIIWSMNSGQNTLDEMLAYLREQLRNLLEYSGIAYKIDFPEIKTATLLNNAQKRNLLLVAKEIVHNTVKHSTAKNISVLVEQKKSSLQFTITDDGCGFDPGNSSYGNGLRNIRRRIEELGGTLQIESARGQGSRFFYTIPLAPIH